MRPIVSVAARSGIVAIAVFVLFIAATVVLLTAPMEHRLRALQRSFVDIPMLTTLAIGWATYLGVLWFSNRKKSDTVRSRSVRIALAVGTTLLTAAVIVALYELIHGLFFGFGLYLMYSSPPWRYWFRLFEAALFAVAIVRIALPLLPRFDRMQPHTV